MKINVTKSVNTNHNTNHHGYDKIIPCIIGSNSMEPLTNLVLCINYRWCYKDSHHAHNLNHKRQHFITKPYTNPDIVYIVKLKIRF